MSQCFPALVFSRWSTQSGWISCRGSFFGASDLLSDLRCNGVHCWEQLWKRWKSSATHEGRGAGRTGFSLAKRHTRYPRTQTDITFDGQDRPRLQTQTLFQSPNPRLNIHPPAPCLRIILSGEIVPITDLLQHWPRALSRVENRRRCTLSLLNKRRIYHRVVVCPCHRSAHRIRLERLDKWAL